MKTSFRLAAILLIITLLAACQKAPATVPTQAPPATDAPAVETAAPAVHATMDPASTGPTVQFLAPTEDYDFLPEIVLFGKPLNDTPMAVNITCNGVESDIWPSYQGTLIRNHCIINNTYQDAYLVLYDGSIIAMRAGSQIQINIEEEEYTEIILQKGEIYNIVAPRCDRRPYTVLVGGMGIKAQGTRFGVKLRDNVISLMVVDGNVITERCLNWATNTCKKWETVSVERLQNYTYNNTIGEIDWTRGEQYNLEHMVPDPTVYVSGYFEILMGDQIHYVDHTKQGTHSDYENVDTARSLLQQYLEEQIGDLSLHERIAGEMNLTYSDYCNSTFDTCLLATPLPWIDNPFNPTPDGGGSNQPPASGGATCPPGNCPLFDASSCFERGGHTWCFPQPGTVDVTMSAEWDVTEICNRYPGEAICSQIR